MLKWSTVMFIWYWNHIALGYLDLGISNELTLLLLVAALERLLRLKPLHVGNMSIKYFSLGFCFRNRFLSGLQRFGYFFNWEIGDTFEKVA